MAAKMACADGIQEYIETLRDLKASNAEQRYLSGLSDKIRAVEKQSITAELETALFVSSPLEKRQKLHPREMVRIFCVLWKTERIPCFHRKAS